MPTPRQRDAGLRRVTDLTRVAAAGALVTSGVFAVVAARVHSTHPRVRSAGAIPAPAPAAPDPSLTTTPAQPAVTTAPAASPAPAAAPAPVTAPPVRVTPPRASRQTPVVVSGSS